MTNIRLAIALCRVSSAEQLENNSLNRQREAVLKAAKELEVTIPEDGWWSGNVSSKRGTNVERRDLREAISYCKKHPRVRYAIVDQPDRFMRSIDEAAYFEVMFRKIGVTVWYASDPELNKGDIASKLLKFTKYLSAEGSNDDRIRQSIGGATAALKEGRYPYPPKPGYVRGYERGIHDIHAVRGPIMKAILIKIADKRLTPPQALVELNSSSFTNDRVPYKMDKFRRIITDPYYAGIVEVNKQVKFRNENGLHEPLITQQQHNEILKIMDRRPKNQSGPIKGGNPDFPLSNIVSCSVCTEEKYGRFVGFKNTNGKNANIVYEKYRCRSCKVYITKADMHNRISAHLKRFSLSPKAQTIVLEQLKEVWERESREAEKDIARLQHRFDTLSLLIKKHAEAAIDPANSSIRQEILQSIADKKAELISITTKIEEGQDALQADKGEFLEFALNYTTRLCDNFFDLSKEERIRCKQIIFPGGLYLDEHKKVFTPQISSIFRLAQKSDATWASGSTRMVRVRRL